MTISRNPIFVFLAPFLLFAAALPQAFAADFSRDVSIMSADIRVPDTLLSGQKAKIYVTVRNSSKSDLSGVVKFFDEKTGQFIGTDQTFSNLAGRTDDVFVEWSSDLLGEHPIAVRVIPWDANGDNPDNNKAVKTIAVDIDTDGDGIANRLDPDDDNDGAPDSQDAFPLDRKEWKDTDRDRMGDNADPDDDNDAVPDLQDAFPQDSRETKDGDRDGHGDNTDVFPYDPNEWGDSDHDGKGDHGDPNPSNHGPIPLIQSSGTLVSAGELVTFNGLKSSDPDGTVSAYHWDFGDGAAAEGILVEHAFQGSGKYWVTLRATDNQNESDERQLQIIVRPNWIFISLIGVSVLLFLMLLGLLIPASRFYWRKLFSKKKKSK